MRLRDMFPVSAFDDPEYCRCRDAELSCKRAVTVFTGIVDRPNFRNGLLIERCASVFRPAKHALRVSLASITVSEWPSLWMRKRPMPHPSRCLLWVCKLSVSLSTSLTAFRNHIRSVVQVRAKKEMQRINAHSEIARMADAEIAGVRPVVDQPRYTMRQSQFATHLKSSVSSPSVVPIPQPAFVWTCFRDLAPKSLNVLRRWVDLILGGWDAVRRFIHRVVVFEFSDALSATTEARCEFMPST